MAGQLLGAPKLQLFDDDGAPVVGGFLFSYEAGTDTPLDTYTDEDLSVPNENPVELDANGRAVVFLTPGVGYKFILQDEDEVQLWEQDDVIIGEPDV